MRIFKDIECPSCKDSFTVGFSEKEQRISGKNVICRNQSCRNILWAPVRGRVKFVRMKHIDWHTNQSDN